jgi:hypothetical protein
MRLHKFSKPSFSQTSANFPWVELKLVVVGTELGVGNHQSNRRKYLALGSDNYKVIYGLKNKMFMTFSPLARE